MGNLIDLEMGKGHLGGMSQEHFISTVAAVLAANLLTVWAFYAARFIGKMKMDEWDKSFIPWRVLFGLTIPPGIMAFGAYLVASSAG